MTTESAEMSDNSKRNLVVDEAAFEEQFLRCHICRDRYDQTEKAPKSLPCNHTFCLPCLIQVFDHSQTNSRRSFTFGDDTYEGVLKCPTCRVEIFLSRGEISTLPNDHRVIQMIDFLSQVVVKSQNLCTKHERQPLNFFCKSCTKPICRDCTVLDHKEGDHTIEDVTTALNENAEEFNKVENGSKQLLQNMKSRSDALANASKQLDLLERQLRSKIKDTFIEYRLLLERRQMGQIAILHDMIKKQKSLINSRFAEVCTQGTQLQKFYDTFAKARPANDITRLFEVHSEIKKNEAKFAQHANASDDELFVGCDFEVLNEPMFLSEMSCLGEIIQKPDLELKKPVPAHQLVFLDVEERRPSEAQLTDHNDCDDFIMTYIEPSRTTTSTSRSVTSRSRHRDIERSARERAREIIERESTFDQDRDLDDTEEMEHDSSNDVITSSYLLRIASRLNASSANLSEAILDLSTDRDTTRSPEGDVPGAASDVSRGSTSRRTSSGQSPTRSRRPGQSVRVVRHPQYRATPDRTDRYISTRYDQPAPSQR